MRIAPFTSKPLNKTLAGFTPMFLAVCALLISGCGSGRIAASAAAAAAGSGLSVLPTAISLEPGVSANFSVQDPPVDAPGCVWTSSNNNILASNGNGSFTAVGPGAATVAVSCGEVDGTASASVTTPTHTQGTTITTGGTYSGIFSSNDPNVAAITISTNQPVIIENATITSKSDLIHIADTGKGSNVTVRNVTGTALDPGVAGKMRGMFVTIEGANILSVQNCTMTGVSFGVYIAATTLNSLSISNNIAYNMEDRPSDGAGGVIISRQFKGHFVQLNNVLATNGADISWNQVINTPGSASVEDVIDMYDSYGGSSAKTINIHDNYLQGAFSTGTVSSYTGGGIMSEGDSPLLARTSGFLQIANNQVVMTGGYGIAISTGHDITMTGNRIVSCGKDTSGNWYTGLSSIAAYLWNGSQSPEYFNNHISGTTGGLVRPNAQGQAMSADSWAPDASAANNDTLTNSAFDDPCWTNGKATSNTAELTERANWNAKVAQAAQVLGDTH